jgi:hypothetical protein
MLTAMLLALLVQSSSDLPVSPPPSVAQPSAVMPQIHDIQTALAGRWEKISSSGMVFHDYMVRNLICSESVLPPPPRGDEKPALTLIMTDKPVSQVRCSFDYASELKKSSPSRLPAERQTPRRFSKREIDRVPKSQWQHEEHELVRISRTACLYMGRTPRDNECSDYWVILI